jgi:hypothetical protein
MRDWKKTMQKPPRLPIFQKKEKLTGFAFASIAEFCGLRSVHRRMLQKGWSKTGNGHRISIPINRCPYTPGHSLNRAAPARIISADRAKFFAAFAQKPLDILAR